MEKPSLDANLIKKYHQDIVYNYAEYPTCDHWSCDFNSEDHKKSLVDWLPENKDKPIFAFIHIFLPHPPFIFGPNGESVTPGIPISSETWDEKIAYIDQLKFANKEITKVIEKILDKIGRIRNVKQGPDGYLYLGVEGKGIIKILPL